MTEWSIVLSWKGSACNSAKGSNPFLSAILSDRIIGSAPSFGLGGEVSLCRFEPYSDNSSRLTPIVQRNPLGCRNSMKGGARLTYTCKDEVPKIRNENYGDIIGYEIFISWTGGGIGRRYDFDVISNKSERISRLQVQILFCPHILQ